jgi:hypothetical protein
MNSGANSNVGIDHHVCGRRHMARRARGARRPCCVMRMRRVTVPTEMVPWLPGMVAGNYMHGAMTYAFVLDNFDALSRKTTEEGRPFLLTGAASGFNESARATALIADQKRLLGDAGDKLAKETAAAIELKSRMRERDGASLAANLSRVATRKH